MAECAHCGLGYGEPGFPDLVVPDDVWKRISPTKDEGGLLCPSCLCAAVESLGIVCEARFTSGPFAVRTPANLLDDESVGEVDRVAKIIIDSLGLEATDERMVKVGMALTGYRRKLLGS